MDTPICVIDAKTFVDHIQDFKKWIYSGQLGLVVPSCTIEQVEQLYQKSIEPKPTTQEAPRSRSSGKPPKKEYPAFDINPRVAREYLGRLKNRKEQDPGSEQRVFFQETEHHEAVQFQQPNEHYTPWKDVEVEEEKPAAVEGPPMSWAETLRKNQNPANGTSEKSTSKAPAKPKLVAKVAGSETSPWKVKKDAPKISVKDVPGALRPLMSCILWRLHESIERNDTNQIFLLSDQTEIRAVAKKLSINVRSWKETGATTISKSSTTSLDTFGDLEREFGVQQKIALSPTIDAHETIGEHGVIDEAGGDLRNEDVMNNSVSSEKTADTETSSIVHDQDLEKHNSKRGEQGPSNDESGEDKAKEQDTNTEMAAPLAAETASRKPAKSVESIKDLVDSIIQHDSQKQLSESVNGLEIDGVKKQTNLADQLSVGHFAMRSMPSIPLPLPQSLDPVELHQVSLSDNVTFPSASKPEVARELEDSDEEVVVFIPQPKRLSAQQKPAQSAQQNPRPSTPKEQSQEKAVSQSPQKPLAKSQVKGKAQRHSPKPSIVGQAYPQPVNSPTVIDPDAFGRESRANLNPSPRLPHKSNGHSNQRNRGNMQNAQVGHIPRNSPRQAARTSPPRSAPQENPRRLTPTPGPSPKDAPNHRRQASRTSPRRVPATKVEEATLADISPRATAAAKNSNPLLPESQLVEPMEFVPQATLSGWNSPLPNGIHESTEMVPRHAFPEAELKLNGPQPRIFEASEFVPRPPRPVREFKPRAPRPKVFEAAEFVPRDFVPRATTPRAQPKQYSSAPESIEPRPSINDVDYVLKSGSTRASARGRGRLWTPS